MITQLTAHDWEALSAYLDEQLNPQERAALEARLQNEPDLQTGLQDLRRTCTLIRRAPKIRAPRNFTLSPSMAGSRRGFRFTPTPYPILGLTSVLATLFFVLITAGSLAVRFTGPAQTEILSSEIENARPVPQFGMGGGGGGGGAGEPPVMMMAPTEAAITLEGESEAAPLTGKALEVTPLAQNQPAPTDGVLEAMTVPQESDLSEDPMSAKALPEPAPEVLAQTTSRGSSAWSFLGVLQVFLVLLAIITGLAALYLRRNPRR